MNRRLQRYIVRTEILTTFHTGVEYKNTLKTPPPIPPLLLRGCGPLSTTPIPRPTTYHPKRHTPFFHNSPTEQTDRQIGRQTDGPTEGIDDKSVTTPAYAPLIV